MTNSDGAEFRLFDTDLTSVLHILRAQEMQINLILNEPGNGAVTIALKSRAAQSAESAMFVEGKYRGGVRGGFFVEGIDKSIATRGEKGEQLMTLMGRGALALLDDAIVWGDGTSATTQEFTGTRAGMLISMIDAAQARGALLNLSYDFSAVVDSTGAAWTDNESLSWSNDTSLLDVARDIAKAGIDLDILPDGAGNFVLSAYKNGKGTDKSGTVYFRVGKNCEEVSSLEDGSGIRNVLKVSHQSGSVIVSDATSISVRRRREHGLNARTAQTAESATTIGAAELELRKDPRKSITVKIYDGVGPRLFIDYVLGDYIMLDIEGVETKYRVRGIKAAWDGKKYADVVVDLNSIILENEILMGQDIAYLMDQWATARDAGLLELSFWAGLGLRSEVTRVDAQYILNGILYVGARTASLAAKLFAYDISTGLWSDYSVPAGGIAAINCFAAIGTDLYYGTSNASLSLTPSVWKFDTLTKTSSLVGSSTGVNHFDGALDGGSCLALAVIGTDLYATGLFSDADGTAVSSLAVWDTVGETWASVGTGITGSGATAPGKTLAVIGSTLIIGGDITFLGAVAANNVGTWNGSVFAALGSGLNGYVYALKVYGTNILAGGAFTGKIAEWDGAVWTTFGGGLNNTVYALDVYLTDVYAGGAFTDAGNYIAKNSGGEWYTLDVGVNGNVYSIVLNELDVYAAGVLTQAGGKNANRAAVYFTNFDSLMDYLENSSAFNMGEAIHAAPAAALTNASELPFWDPATNALRKIAWVDVKTALADVFVPFTGAAYDVDLGIHTLSASKINNVTITAPATGSTLTILDGKTFTVNRTLTLAGSSDGLTLTVPESMTAAGRNVANTFTTRQDFTPTSVLTSGTALAINITHQISAPSNSTADFRSLFFLNSIGINSSDTTTYSLIRGIYVSNRPRTSGLITSTYGHNIEAMALDSSSANATGSAVFGVNVTGLSRPSGAATAVITNIYGYYFTGVNFAGNTITAIDGYIANVATAASTITTATGFKVVAPTNATITNLYGMDIQGMALASSVNIGLRIAGASTYTLQLSSTAGTPASGITFGTDTNLYRSAANSLKSNAGALWIVGASAPSIIVSEADDPAQFFRMRDISTNQGEIDKITTSGASIIDINPKPQDGVGAAAFRFFRSSSTTGRAAFDVYNANQTTPLNNTSIAGNGYTYLNGYYGNTAIGSAINAASTFAVSQRANGAGTVTTNGTATLTGSGTDFVNQFKVGDTITVSGETVRTIATISSATSLTVTVAFSTTASGLTYTLVGGVRFAVYGNGQSYFYGVMYPQPLATASAPTFANGGIWFDTTLDKLKVGGASAWETVLTDTFTAYRGLYTNGSGNVVTSTSFVFDEAGAAATFGVTASAQPPMQFYFSSTSTLLLLTNHAGTVGNQVKGIAVGGTPAAETAIGADVSLFRIRGAGYDGVVGVGSSTTSAEIRLVSSAAYTSTVHGSRIEFWTTPNTASASITRSLILDNDGSLAIIDGIPAPAALLGFVKFYADAADGDLKVRFGDGTIKTLVTDT